MFQFPTFAHASSVWCGRAAPGCPIRTSADQVVFADPRSFSQLITSFLASESQGILHMPFFAFFLSLLLEFSLFEFCSFLFVCFQYVNDLSVENNGFEPLTPCLQSRCSSQLS